MKIEVNFKITENALKEIRKVKVEDPELTNSYLRVSVKGGGCSGFMYGLEFEQEPEADDFVENFDDVKVLIDKKSALFLNDVTLDWLDDINQRGFKFSNPNATKTCGCGQSFQ